MDNIAAAWQARVEALENLLWQTRQSLSPAIPAGAAVVITGPTTFAATLLNRTLLCDCTAGPVTINLPTITANNIVFIVKDWKGQSAVNPITVNAPATWAIENPANVGTQASAGVIAVQGAVAQWIAVLADSAGVTRKQLIEVV